MYQVAAAVRALGTRDLFDYVSVAAPLLLSVIAIVVSLYTVHKQNQIAVFNLRYEALHSLALIISYARVVTKSNNNLKSAQVAFNANFGVNIDFSDKITAVQQMYIALRKIEKDVLTIEYAFPRQDMKDINEIFICFRNYMEHLVLGEVSVTWATKLNELCDAFEKGQYKKLERKTSMFRRRMR